MPQVHDQISKLDACPNLMRQIIGDTRAIPQTG